MSNARRNIVYSSCFASLKPVTTGLLSLSLRLREVLQKFFYELLDVNRYIIRSQYLQCTFDTEVTLMLDLDG